ncbi:uncharacterized protein FMAN_11881 [Fusarium mangiferae]|uniref:FAD dependent oxidoreductase domain-containing protein n=1 Tax=Fusarium mangiferae TaxID=192010 RepID=A0A1L7UFJ0_FUSMA|nr:uncharacterized protein FMAN_11881 [Fusarium mangiferae]CVL06785.1 uncharacterized protein FMAN_11881 [Fusarium mangiferae]
MEDNNAIIIVGAGCIGLCTAYELSKSFDDQERMPRIIVAEACDRPFAAASSACTGCFHYHFPGPLSKALTPLGKYSFDLWAQEAQNADFRLATGYLENSSYSILQGDGKGLDRLPDWIKTEAFWDVDNHVLGNKTATVNPLGVGKWLTQQCLARGVKIVLNTEILAVELSTLNELRAVNLRNGHQKTNIACKQMLLACGPWTPTSTAFVSFESYIGEKFEFAGRNDGSIWVCGRRNFNAKLPSPGQSDEPDNALIEEMSRLARKWLNRDCSHHEEHCDDVQIVKKGRAFRPATKSELPVMSKVKPSDITPNYTSHSTGIFVCCGHGSWGLTLGMGSGRVMSQTIRGEQSDIDLSPFSLALNTTSCA